MERGGGSSPAALPPRWVVRFLGTGVGRSAADMRGAGGKGRKRVADGGGREERLPQE
jgi:hypothetical protein